MSPEFECTVSLSNETMFLLWSAMPSMHFAFMYKQYWQPSLNLEAFHFNYKEQ